LCFIIPINGISGKLENLVRRASLAVAAAGVPIAVYILSAVIAGADYFEIRPAKDFDGKREITVR